MPRRRLIGPHEGRELGLMLTGRKPVAMFSDVAPECGAIPEEKFRPYVESGRFVRFEDAFTLDDGLQVRIVYFARLEESWRIDELRRLHNTFLRSEREWTATDDIAVGRLLGYSEEEIAAFMRRDGKGRKPKVQGRDSSPRQAAAGGPSRRR